MKKLIVVLVLCASISTVHAQSVDPVSLLIAKVIKAIDLQVQKMQNQTIRLQHAQQVAEHELSKLKLSEIADWQQKQQQLFADYFKELQTVRTTVKSLPQVNHIFSLQAEVMVVYNRLAKQGVLLSAADKVLGLSKDLLSTLDEVIRGNELIMRDAERIQRIYSLRAAMLNCLDDMKSLDKERVRFEAIQKQQQSDLKKLQQFK